MTTIVANLEGMAADQRATDDGPPFCHTKKLHPIGHSIFGLAGDCHMGLAVIEWLQTPKRNRLQLYKMLGDEAIEWRYEIVLLELSETGLALWNGWGVKMPLLDTAYAIGTGAAAALDAIEHGATLEESILRAMKRDQYSGVLTEPDVAYLLPPELKQKPKVKRKR